MVKQAYTFNGVFSLSLTAESYPDERLIDGLVSALVQEINFRASEGDWELKGILEAGAALLALKEDYQAKVRLASESTAEADQEDDDAEAV